MFTLSLFPPEVFLHVLSFLPAKDILTCRQACKLVNKLIEESSHLQLIIELALHGLRLRRYPPNGQSTQSAIERLEEFRRSREAWKHLKHIQTTPVELSQYEYEISEGAFGHALRDETGRFRGIEFVRLWADRKGERNNVWRRYEDVGVDMSDFTFDHTEDLLVLVQSPMSGGIRGPTKRLFLRSLSDNNPHPRASQAILESPGDEVWRLCDLKICGNILGVHFDNFQEPHSFGRLTIWDWPSGEIIRTCSGVGGYAFLTPSIIMNVVHKEDAAEEEIRDTPDYALLCIELEIWDSSNPALPFVRLALPPFKRPPGNINVFSERPSADSPKFPSDLYISPYTHDETAERIVAIQFMDINQHVIISVQKLLKFVDKSSVVPTETEPGKGSRYGWAEWGSESTFWFRARDVDAGYTSISGARFVALTGYRNLFRTDENGRILESRVYRRRSGSPTMDILILDFNQRPIIRDSLIRGEEDDEGVEWEIDGLTLPEGVTCRLQFRAFQYTTERSHLDLILGIDHLVAITVRLILKPVINNERSIPTATAII